jgi:hypothetical protein
MRSTPHVQRTGTPVRSPAARRPRGL